MWVPILALSTVAAETVIDAFVAEPGKWPAVIIWSLALAAFGYVGVLVLRMTREEWAGFREPAKPRDSFNQQLNSSKPGHAV